MATDFPRRGMAHGNRDKGIKSNNDTLLGDGEMEEGSNWKQFFMQHPENWTMWLQS